MVFVAAVAMWVTAGCGRRAVDLMDRADALLDDRPDSAKVLLVTTLCFIMPWIGMKSTLTADLAIICGRFITTVIDCLNLRTLSLQSII